MTHRDDFIKTYGRKPTESQLRAFARMIDLIKSERRKFGVLMRYP